MKSNTLIALGALTAVVAGAALWVSSRTPAGVEARSASGQALFGELRERVNDVAEVTVTTSAESFTLRRGERGWGLADKGGYPVDVDRVKALVLGIAELTLVEEKTANPELWPRLELQDPGSDPEAPSKRVRLADAGGTVLADVVVGRQTFGGGPGQSTLFVRRADGGPALEARGRVTVDGAASDWLDREVAKIERKRVHEVTISHPDGETLRVFRESPDLSDFDVADLPEGAELSWAGVAGGVAGALEYLNLEDVLPASEAQFDDSQAVAARFTTFDGLVVTARTLERDGDVLLKVEAVYDEAERAPEPAGPPAPEGEDAAQPPPAPAGKSVEEVQAEAQALAAKVGEWIYVVPGYAGANLRKRLEDLLKQPEEQPEPMLEEAPLAPTEGGGDEPAAPGVPLEAPTSAGGEPQTDPAGGSEPSEPEPKPAGGEPAGGEPAGGGGG